MNPINASSLLHFTKYYSTLESILAKGFRFSYCCEYVNPSIVINELYPEIASYMRVNAEIKPYIAIPMICFCDIPLTRAKRHSDFYGKFIIGIDKDFARTLYGDLLNPVIYRISDDFNYALNDLSVIKAKFFNQDEQSKDFYNVKRSLNQIIGLTKQYSGNFQGEERYCFYDEREWRILLPYDYDKNVKWYWNVNPKDFLLKKDDYNSILYKTPWAYRGFVQELDKNNEENFSKFITHIIVEEDKDIPKIVKFILDKKQNLFGYNNISEDIREILVSKVSSFNRIEKDF